MTQELERLTEDHLADSARADEAEARAKELDDQINRVISQDERVWERPVSGTPFRPLATRRGPIIAVLNLKGGVGKTTITANLAGLMAQRGQKVLVIDADYQRNLSMLLVSDKDRKMLHLEKRTLQHFLSGTSSSPGFPAGVVEEKRTLQHFLSGTSHNWTSLLGASHEVTHLCDCRIVINSDARQRIPGAGSSANARPVPEDIGLEDIENRLMAQWLFRPDGPDVRLFLREALHEVRLQQADNSYVLIDCPPRLSTACITALAASDFILIPVLLDATSARSVPNLLRTLRCLRDGNIFPNLKVLGVVANGVRYHSDQLIAQQQKTWGELPAVCRAGWGVDIHRFEAMIPYSQKFAHYAGSVTETGEGSRLALQDTTINDNFSDLLQELETRIHYESERLATVSS